MASQAHNILKRCSVSLGREENHVPGQIDKDVEAIFRGGQKNLKCSRTSATETPQGVLDRKSANNEIEIKRSSALLKLNNQQQTVVMALL